MARRSNVTGHTYDAETRTLEVTFHQGKVYTYHDVDPGTASNFERAGASGSALHQIIIPFHDVVAS